MERGINTSMRGNKGQDKAEYLAAVNDYTADRNARLEFVTTGLSGKQLNTDDFKFDEKFGGKFHNQQFDKPSSGWDFDQNSQRGGNPAGNAVSSPFDAYGQVYQGGSGAPQQQSTQNGFSQSNSSGNNWAFGGGQGPQTTKPAEGGKGGFLDFDLPTTGNSNKNYNPFL